MGGGGSMDRREKKQTAIADGHGQKHASVNTTNDMIILTPYTARLGTGSELQQKLYMQTVGNSYAR